MMEDFGMAILENCMKAEIFDIVDNTLLCTSYVSQGPMESILLEVPRTIDWKSTPSAGWSSTTPRWGG